MATVVNNPGDSSSGAGWVTAIILLLVVFVLGWFALSRFSNVPAPQETADTINVTIPTPDVPTMDPTPTPAPSGGAGGQVEGGANAQ